MLRTCNRMLFVCVAFKYSIAKSPLRVYGGSDANPDEYPYVVRLERQVNVEIENSTIIRTQNFHICTASAIADKWVLTAAHCLRAIETLVGTPVIRYGHVLHSPWNKDTFSDVLLMIIHPLYSDIGPGSLIISIRNDIGLMKATPMKIRTFMKLSAVDYLTFYGHEAIFAGFGITSKKFASDITLTNTTLNLQMPLQVLNVLVTKCLGIYKSLLAGLCITPKCGFVAISCPGDSGGPLIHPSGQIGILTGSEFTSLCLSPIKKKRTFSAGMVLAISPYVEWINSYVTL